MNKKHRVAILGGGAIGIVSALEILRAGHAVTIIEPGEPGGPQAASYGNAGWLSSHSVIPPSEPGIWKKVPGYLIDPLGPLAIRWRYLPKIAPWLMRYLLSGFTAARVERTARALRPLLVGAPGLHKSLAAEAGVPHLIEQAGVMHIFHSRADFEAARVAWEIRRKVGITWLELSGDELRQREPDLDRRYTFGLLVEEAGRCRNPGAYVAALADLARARGAVFVGDKAVRLRIEAGRLVSVVTAAHGEIACDRAVICAGAHSQPLAASAGDRVPLESERGYHVVIANPPVGLRTSAMASDTKMVINATDSGLRAAGQVEFAGLDAAPDWRRADILRDNLLGMFPGLPRDLAASRIKVWMGHRPSTPDGLPVIGHARSTEDVVYAFGHGHVGLVSSARTGRVVAQLIDGREPEIPVAPFAATRFRRRGR
ncbi:FAD-binding oxidoreductase [Beijerinckia sp. L45]|uniref:NAD(P)/FAD-dependent oxidoreductase n=1 Tax=Beijerinckia sp. L45 TaxID=1641855 RepID=UPI001FEEA821|nr:FAD-binding oxidoreductase [Beijerinckia sp. L45]